MKNTKTIALTSLAVLLGLGLGACAGDEPASSDTGASDPGSSDTSISVTPTASAIVNNLTAPVAAGVAIDLDEYITVRYSDSSTDKNYSVSCNSTDVTISGHSVTANTVGQFTLDIASADGNRNIRATLDARSQENIEILEFLDPIYESDINFTIDELNLDGSYAGMTYVHTENYGVAYDKTNPGAVDEDGVATSFVIGYLADGEAYMGYFDEDDKLVFEPGKYTSNYAYYYMGGYGTFPDPLLFESRVGDDGEVEVYGGTDLTQALFYAISRPYDAYTWNPGYAFGGYKETEVLGLYDMDGDGVDDTLCVVPFFSILTTSGGVTTEQTYYDSVFAIYDIGTSKVDAMEAARVDESYVPEVIVPTPMINAFAAIEEGGNYTVTMSLYASDDEGNPVATYDNSYAFYSMFGKAGHHEVNKVTADGIFASYYELTNGIETSTLANEFGYFNNGGAGYSFSRKTEEVTNEDGSKSEVLAEGYDVTAMENVTDVFSNAGVKELTAGSVANTDFLELNITAHETSTVEGNTVHNYVSEVGDNNGLERTNSLFENLFNQFGAIGFSGTGVGTTLTENQEFNQGDQHALTLYSDYTALEVTETTNEIHIEALVYLPIGYDNPYMVASYTISDIGTTTATFPEVPAAA